MVKTISEWLCAGTQTCEWEGERKIPQWGCTKASRTHSCSLYNRSVLHLTWYTTHVHDAHSILSPSKLALHDSFLYTGMFPRNGCVVLIYTRHEHYWWSTILGCTFLFIGTKNSCVNKLWAIFCVSLPAYLCLCECMPISASVSVTLNEGQEHLNWYQNLDHCGLSLY